MRFRWLGDDVIKCIKEVPEKNFFFMMAPKRQPSTAGAGQTTKKAHWTDDAEELVPPTQLDQMMPTPHETPHDVNLVDQMGYVNICGVGTIRTFVVGLT